MDGVVCSLSLPAGFYLMILAGIKTADYRHILVLPIHSKKSFSYCLSKECYQREIVKFLSIGSLNEKLGILLMLAVLPALALLLYSGIEQRQVSIETARKQVFQLTNTMAHSLDGMTNSIKNIHSTLSLFPAVQNKDAQACINIFKAVLNDNPNYKNIALVDLTSNVIASGKPYVKTNLSDRKHFREVLENKKFAVGEYIISRVGTSAPAFGFAHPVFDEKGNLTAILTAIIELANYANFHSLLNLQERSFIAITDHQGTRLFYHPAQSSTNPVGKPIKARSWQMAKAAHGPGSFISKGSDGHKRLFAFEQVRLLPGEPPYLYVWAGIPEANILKPANAQLTRNLILMFIVAMTSFLASRVK
ncbi:MAG: hypothetical protein GY705_18910 [Bacteroidetes bacterium]|nr:hypothetical protein [Bacteroidota bacterium]